MQNEELFIDKFLPLANTFCGLPIRENHFLKPEKGKSIRVRDLEKGIVQLQQGNMATQGINVVVFLSSVRPNRMADRIWKHLLEAISAKGMTPVLMGMTRKFYAVSHEHNN